MRSAEHHELSALMDKAGAFGCHLFRVECLCGWGTPWFASLVPLLYDVHRHRSARRRCRA